MSWSAILFTCTCEYEFDNYNLHWLVIPRDRVTAF